MLNMRKYGGGQGKKVRLEKRALRDSNRIASGGVRMYLFRILD
jgi:hypothetical protein